MNIKSLNSINSVTYNINKKDNKVTNPNFTAKSTIQIPQKQMVNAFLSLKEKGF